MEGLMIGNRSSESKNTPSKVFITTLKLFFTSERRETRKFVFMIMIELKTALKYFVFGMQINKLIRKQITIFGCPISIENLVGKDEKKIRVKNKNQFNLFLRSVFVRR